MKINEINNKEKIQAIKKFTGWAKQRLEITGTPKIKLTTNKKYVTDKRTFGTTSSNGEIWVYIENRNLADILRTLCHELVHFKQFSDGTAHDHMNEQQHQQIEDEANAMAGRLMRDYGKQHAEIYEGRTSSMQSAVAAALPATYAIPELKNQDPYLQYRFGVAMAGAKGAKKRSEDGVQTLSKESSWGENQIVVSSDPNIEQYIDDALKQLGIKGKRLISTKQSEETSNVGKTSVLKPFGGYPRKS
jgi:hypothetical protein